MLRRALLAAAAATLLALPLGAQSARAGCGFNPTRYDYGPSWTLRDDISFSRVDLGCGAYVYEALVPSRGGTVTALPPLATVSPDGATVAYSNGGIWLRGTHGGDPVQLTTGSDFPPGWSPDGKTLAFVRLDDGLYTINTDGTGLRKLAPSAVVADTPLWSPDGRWIAADTGKPNPGALQLVRSDGSGVQALASAGFFRAWAPDSSRLSFVGGADSQLEVVDTSGVVHESTAVPNLAAPPRWTPRNTVLTLLADGAIAEFDRDLQPVRRLDVGATDFDVARDGRLAWTAADGIHVAAADGSSPRTYALDGASDPAFSPGGGRLAYAATKQFCGGPGIDVLDLASGSTTILTNDCWIRGTDAGDTLTGTEDTDAIFGEGGDDTIDGLGNPDTVFGGDGNDTIDGGNDGDVIDGGPGDDRISGGWGRDTITGGPGEDTIDGGGARDRIEARDGGHDTIRCGSGFDVVVADPIDAVASDCEGVLRHAGDRVLYAEPGKPVAGGAGNDVLIGTVGKDVLSGGPGNDVLYDDNGSDRVLGGAGNDRLIGGNGRDLLFGGSGNDRIEARDGFSDVVDCGAGVDTALVDSKDVVRHCEHVRR